MNENNIFSNLFKYSKVYINKNTKINAYFESSIEKALELVKRKKFNKIIRFKWQKIH